MIEQYPIYAVLYYGYNVSKDISKQIMDEESFDNYVSILEKTKTINDIVIWLLGSISGIEIGFSIFYFKDLIKTLFLKASFFWAFAGFFGSIIGFGFIVSNAYYLNIILFEIEGYDNITSELLNKEIEIIISLKKLYFIALIETSIIVE